MRAREQEEETEDMKHFLTNTFIVQISTKSKLATLNIPEGNGVTADTEASSHCACINGPCGRIPPTLQAINVSCQNREKMRSSHQGVLPFRVSHSTDVGLMFKRKC